MPAAEKEVDSIMKNEIIKAPVNIPVEKLHPFEGHPYKVLDNEEMNALIKSIQEQGILSPIIVRPLENTADEYEIISGHRRLHASVKAGLKTVPVLIYALNRDDAAIVLVDSNMHREHILPSEKAFSYRMKMDALSRQGKRTDLTSDQVGRKLETAEIIGEQTNESKNQVRRYIRLTNLIPEILQYVDDGKIALNPAVELSYLTEQEQFDLFSTMGSEDCTPSLSQAQQMKKFSQEGALNMDKIFEMLTTPKANQLEKLKIPMERIHSFFPKEYTPTQMEDEIVKALEEQRQRARRRSDRDAR
jgi:ParB family chromosome partitioning protein